jgi:DNA repair exonuclease SbcCD ATPase subunit
MRAIRWAIWNKPSGENFRSWGTKEVSVGLEFDDGVKVKRTKGQKNTYKLNGEKFTGFGQSVPEPITNALRINPDAFVRQVDPHFLLSRKPGDVAKYMNELANIGKADRGVKYAESKVRANERRQQDIAKSIKEEEADLGSLGYIEDMRREIAEVEKLAKIVEEKEKKGEKLSEISERIKGLEADLAEMDKVVQLEPQLNEVLSKKEEIKQVRADISGLRVFEKKIKTALDDLKTEEENLEELEKEFHDKFPDICPLCGELRRR